VCNKPVALKDCVIHHLRNKSQKGKESLSNGEARHRDCEVWCHENFKYGNPDHRDNYVPRKDADPHYYQGRKGRKSHDYNKDRYDEIRVWRFYCRTGRLPER
jgi:hypothetical protein